MFFEYLGILIVFGLILAAAYLATRFMAGKTEKLIKGKYIKVIETVMLGKDKKLHLVKIGGKYLLLASCDKCIELIEELEAVDFDNAIDTNAEQKVFSMPDFKSIIKNTLNLYKSRVTVMKSEKNVKFKDDKFKDNLDKLKEIRQKSEKT